MMDFAPAERDYMCAKPVGKAQLHIIKTTELATDRVWGADFEVEVVVVGGVVVRGQHQGEAAARAVADHAQEIAIGRAAVGPITFYADAAAIRQFESRDIDRAGGGMAAAVVGARYVAAVVAAHGVDPHQRTAQHHARGAINPEPRPPFER